MSLTDSDRRSLAITAHTEICETPLLRDSSTTRLMISCGLRSLLSPSAIGSKKDYPEKFAEFEQHICSTREWKVVRDLSNRVRHLELSTPALASLSLGRDYLGGDAYELKVWDGETHRPALQIANALKQRIGRLVFLG